MNYSHYHKQAFLDRLQLKDKKLKPRDNNSKLKQKTQGFGKICEKSNKNSLK